MIELIEGCLGRNCTIKMIVNDLYKKEEPLNLTIPLLWQGNNAPSYFIWKINEKIGDEINNANVAIIDLTATNINRRLDMKKPTDLSLVVDLLKQS